MNLTDLTALVRSQLRDENDEFISDDEIKMWVNIAQRELADRLNLIQGETVGGTVTDSKFALPAEFIEPNVLTVGGERYEFVADEYFEQALDYDAGFSSLSARIWNGYVELAPTVANGVTYDFRYTKGPTDLAAGGDTSVLPVELHPRLAWYATAMALLKEREEGMADRFIQMYSNGLPPSANGQNRLRPGPFRLTYEPTEWDRQGSHTGVGGV